MTPVVELCGLEKSWPGRSQPVRAVRRVNLSIETGEIVALLGPNGAGKSTTIDMLLGLAAPDAGTVSIKGAPPRESVNRGRVGAMLQTGELIRDLSVRELIAMMASLYPAPLPVAQTLAIAGLDDAADQRTQKLSGGQSQRVRFALAIASDPELLILDEPTVAMDVAARHAFWTAMRNFAARGRTVMFATHYLEEADANADRVVMMAHGRIVADGPTSEIKARVGTRTIRATLPSVPLDELAGLPGVSAADRHGETVILSCANADNAARALFIRYDDVRDVEISGAGLEEAFLRLTTDRDAEDVAR
ncbi:MAG: ABC transporter ATP-binding protein [Solirubrobacteraceae bacterium]